MWYTNLMKKYYFLILLCLAISGVFISPHFVLSEENSTAQVNQLNTQIEEKKQKIKQIEESIEKNRKIIGKLRTEAVSLSNQLSILDNRVVQVELDIEATTEKIDTLNLEIERLTISITKKEADIAKQKNILAEFIRTIHQEEGKNMLEIISAYTNFSDFYTRLQYLETIEEDIGKSARSLRLAQVELEEKKDETEQRQTIYVSLSEELEAKKEELEEQTFLQGNLLAKTQSSELQFKSLQSTLKKQAAQIENEISSIEQEVRKRLEQQNKLDPAEDSAPGLMTWPAPSKFVTAYFHDPDYPYRHVFEHSGLDIRAPQGTALRAAASGYVARARRCSNSSCYSYLVLVHSGGLSTVYGHTSKILVSEDNFVAKGEVIALSGGTPGTIGAGPFVTGPHLHFEVRKNGIPVNPLAYLQQ